MIYVKKDGFFHRLGECHDEDRTITTIPGYEEIKIGSFMRESKGGPIQLEESVEVITRDEFREALEQAKTVLYA